MAELQVSSGIAARDALCAAFDSARHDIRAEFYRITDPRIIASLNDAAARGVDVRIELEGAPDRYHRGVRDKSKPVRAVDAIAEARARFSPLVHVDVSLDPTVLLHAKAAVVDGRQALVATANQTPSGCYSPGSVVVSDSNASDVVALRDALSRKDEECGAHLLAGPGVALRSNLQPLFASDADLNIAVEDLSDPQIVEALEARRVNGHADRILLDACKKVSVTEARTIRELEHCGVAVRALPKQYMHEKYVDAGTEIYVGSANLTHNGLDEAREVAIIAAPDCFADGAKSLRNEFESNWARARPIKLRGCVAQALETAA